MSIHDGARLCYGLGMVLAVVSWFRPTWALLPGAVLIEGLGGLLALGG